MAKPIISPVVPTVTSPAAGSRPLVRHDEASPIPATSLLNCLTKPQVAELLQVSVWTVARMAAAGEIQKVKVRRLVRFSPTEVEAFLTKKAEIAKAESGKFHAAPGRPGRPSLPQSKT